MAMLNNQMVNHCFPLVFTTKYDHAMGVHVRFHLVIFPVKSPLKWGQSPLNHHFFMLITIKSVLNPVEPPFFHAENYHFLLLSSPFFVKKHHFLRVNSPWNGAEVVYRWLHGGPSGAVPMTIYCSVVWNMFIFHNILGRSWSQLTNSIVFQKGRYTTNQYKLMVYLGKL